MSYHHAMSTEVTEPVSCAEHGLLKITHHERECLHGSSLEYIKAEAERISLLTSDS